MHWMAPWREWLTMVTGIFKYNCFASIISGTKGKKGTPGVKGNPGHFAMKFVNLRSNQTTFMTLPKQNSRNYSEDFRFVVDSLKVNLKTGVYTICPNEQDVAQYTCLAFATATLYLLVQPRPKNISKALSSSAKNGSKRVTFLDCLLSRSNTCWAQSSKRQWHGASPLKY